MTDSPKVTLAKNLILARTAKSMTQDALAAAAGLSRATIAQIESGESDPHLSTIAVIADVLEVSLILLLIGEQELLALAKIAQSTSNELMKNNPTPAEVEKMKTLIQSGMPKNQIKAAKIGISSAQAAGLTAIGAIAGAAIGTALVPGLGTTIGTMLGGLLHKTEIHKTSENNSDKD